VLAGIQRLAVRQPAGAIAEVNGDEATTRGADRDIDVAVAVEVTAFVGAGFACARHRHDRKRLIAAESIVQKNAQVVRALVRHHEVGPGVAIEIAGVRTIRRNARFARASNRYGPELAELHTGRSGRRRKRPAVTTLEPCTIGPPNRPTTQRRHHNFARSECTLRNETQFTVARLEYQRPGMRARPPTEDPNRTGIDARPIDLTIQPEAQCRIP
jgi:hypothetical protein